MAETFNNGESNASVRAKLNANAIELTSATDALVNKADLIAGVLPVGQLPDIPASNLPQIDLYQFFDSSQFSVVNGKITYTGNAPIETLETPTLTFGVSTSTSNLMNWTEVPNAVVYVLQRLDGVTWNTIYSGALLTYTDMGLTPSTAYSYRLFATATGYNNSAAAADSKTTEPASGGEFLDVLDWTPDDAARVDIVGNNLNYITAVRVQSGKRLLEGVAGSLKAISVGAVLGIGHDTSDSENFNDLVGGIYKGTNNNTIRVFFAGAQIAETDPVSGDAIVNFEITNTGGTGGIGEIISILNGSEIAGSRVDRPAGVFRIKSYGSDDETLTDIQQIGFV